MLKNSKDLAALDSEKFRFILEKYGEDQEKEAI